MQAHMKRHRTEANTFERSERLISADEMIQRICGKRPEWAVMLRGLRVREGLTQTSLGQMIGVEQTNISKMELGKRPIGKNIAKKLSKLFKIDYRLFL